MAFRGYELNLMLRVQDRASSRLRRLSHDIGGVNRAAQLQRSAGRLAAQQTRSQLDMSKTLVQREALLAQKGTERLRTEAQMLRLKAQEGVLADKISRMTPGIRGSAQGQAILKRYQAVQKDIVRLEEVRRIAIRNNNIALADQLVLEEQLKREIEQQAIAQRAAEKAALAQRRARTATHIGSAALIAGGVGVVASAAAASQFANFNRLAVGAATQMRGTNESFLETVKISKVVESSLLDLTRQFPASADEMAKSIYDIASGMNFQIDRTSRLTETQQRYNQSLTLLKRANEVAIAGNVDLNTATDVLITTFNNFDPAVQHPVKLLDSLFATVRFGKGTFAQFAPQIGRVAAAANAAGQPINEMGGALAFLSQRFPLSQAATSLTRILQIVGRKEFTTGFEKLFNISPFREGTRQLRNLSDLMFIIEKQGPKIWKGFISGQGDAKKGSVDLMNVLQNITAAGQDVIAGKPGHRGLVSTQWARQGVVDLVLFGKEYRNVTHDVSSTQGEFMNSLNAFRNQPGVQWQIAINQFKAFGIIIGQTVLPAILKFFDWINHLLDVFRDLSPHTQRMIGSFAAWGSIIIFVGGAVTTLLGGLAILVTSLRVLTSSLGTANGQVGIIGRLGLMSRLLTTLAAFGTIKIGMELIKKGDQSLWSTILGGAAQVGGAAFLGSRLAGWQGAAIAGAFAAYSIPMQLAAAEMKKQGEVSKETIDKEIARIKTFQAAVASLQGKDVAKQSGIKARTILIRAVYQQEGLQGIKNTEKYMTGTLRRMHQNLLNYARNFHVSPQWAEDHKNIMMELSKKNKTTTDSILKNWQDLAASLTGLDVFGGVNKSMATAAANVQLDLAKALATGNTTTQKAALNRQIKSDQDMIATILKTPKNQRTAEQVKNLIQLYNDIGTQRGRLEAIDNAAAAAQKKATVATQKHTREVDRHKKAIERANNAYKTAERRIDSLKLKFKQLKEEALDKLRSAFGDIFGGPLMQGPIGQAFTGISNTLAGFGKTFPIPAQFILQDQKLQQSNFDQLTKDLTFLQKRGVGPKTIQNILGQGSAALPFLEGIRKGTPAQQKEFIQNLKSRNSALLDALQTPWQKQITASNTQLQAAKLQLKAAQDHVAQTKKGKAATQKPIKPKAEPTRTTQSVVHHHHGDNITITTPGPTGKQMKAAWDRIAFDKRNRL